MQPLYPADFGAITVLGHDVPRTVASLRSGLDGFERLPFDGPSGEELLGAPVRGYAEGLGGVARYEALAVAALAPILSRVPAEAQRRVALALCLPCATRPGVPADLEPQLKQRFCERWRLRPEQVSTVSRGRASAFLALAQQKWMELPDCYPIVGGVDVLTNGNSLRQLSDSGAIKEEWDGFIPGEAAAFVRLSRKPPGSGYWQGPASVISGIGSAVELASGAKDDPLAGVGYCDAWQLAARAAGVDETQVELRVNDMNGERASFEDEGMGFVRFFRSSREQALDVWHLGSHFGETGAAAGVLTLLWASAALELGFTDAKWVMLSCGEGAARVALVLRAPSGANTGAQRPAVSLRGPAFHGQDVREHVQTADPGIRLKGVDQAHRDLMQSNFDALASLLLVREQHQSDRHAPWLEIESYETRMLAHVDAIGWSRSAALELMLAWLRSEEPEEVAAAALLAGAGVVDLRVAHELSLIIAAADEPRARLSAKYLAAAQPIASTLRVLQSALAARAPVAQIGVALEGLSLCGALTAHTLTPLIELGRPELVALLLEHAARIGASELCQDILHVLDQDGSACPAQGFLGYLALMPNGSALPMYPLATYLNEAPHVVAHHCLASAASFHVLIAADAEPRPNWIRALGWCGEVDASARLLSLLEHDDAEVAAEAACALHRMLGAELYEEVELRDEDDEPDEEPLRVRRLTLAPERWLKALADLAPAAGSRLRHGRPWSRESALPSLRDPRLAGPDRHWACWEHAVQSKQGFPVHPQHFVKAQRERLGIAALP